MSDRLRSSNSRQPVVLIILATSSLSSCSNPTGFDGWTHAKPVTPRRNLQFPSESNRRSVRARPRRPFPARCLSAAGQLSRLPGSATPANRRHPGFAGTVLCYLNCGLLLLTDGISSRRNRQRLPSWSSRSPATGTNLEGSPPSRSMHVDRRRGDRWQQLGLRISVQMDRTTIFSVKM
jgi:hypothetical protein